MSKRKTSQATPRKKISEETESYAISPLLREAILLLSLAVGGLIFAILIGYEQILLDHFGGDAGAWLGETLFNFFGFVSYLLPLCIIFTGWIFFQAKIIFPKEDYRHASLRLFGFLLGLIGANSFISTLFSQLKLPFNPGGYFGEFFSQLSVSVLGVAASAIIFAACFLIGVTLFTGLSWIKVLDSTGRGCLAFMHFSHENILRFKAFLTERKIQRQLLKDAEPVKPIPKMKEKKFAAAVVPPRIEKPQPAPTTSVRARKDLQKTLFHNLEDTDLPSLALLDQSTSTKIQVNTEALETMSREVEARLLDFGVEVQVVAVHPGPVITRYEMQLAPGIKVSKISGLAKDLARSLSVPSVRIVEVIPGKTTVGLEIPNEDREIVRLSEVLSSQQYEQAKSLLSLALGKDIAGHPVIVDLAKMPHLLVAGTTGSGKSVGVNAMLLSLLFKAQPDEVRLIMIDPKMLELSIYADIPHLLTPVVTDMKEAANALRWCVAEMDRRYKLMSMLGVRNLAGYNQKIRDAEKADKPILDPLWNPANSLSEEQPTLNTLPFIVVVIDEFADMIMVVGKKVEELIARIAQKARAAGIHMILATQRPSVDVITGLIKANVPARIAFQVSSRIDSRTIMDQQGAEQLLGNGDMLYLTPGSGLPIRVHGAFVSDQEVHAVVTDWKSRGEPEYIEQVTQTRDPSEPSEDGDDEQDPLYDEACNIVIETRKASISSIQRRLKIGYNRAARLVEAMEAAGLVGPMESNGNREVLVPGPEGN